MNLDTMTDPQRKSVTRVSGPLLLCAGAGSGKTFTLQQRIAYALSPTSGPAVKSIDEILAITFTDKAAAEIKSRVRAVLREEGMFEEALRVDAAWISTIHGMCGRILREHAFELGLDPSFVQLDEVQADEMLAQAISCVLERNREEEGGRYQALFVEYGTNDASDNSVAALVERVLRQSSLLSDGLYGFRSGIAETPSPSAIARDVLVAYEEALMYELSAKQQETMEDGAAKLQEYLELPEADEDEEWEALELLLEDLPRPDLRGNKAKEARRDALTALDQAILEVNLAKGAALSGDLLALAYEVEETYGQMKRAAGAIDMSDLLKLGLSALSDYPTIANQYCDRFKLVMVDEFQDTNQLQIDLIQKLCGPRLERLCTVGDSQQSIYRFLGADVNVYMQHKRDMESDRVNAWCLELDKNFRSHPDILSFVRKVCGQEGFFVERFLDLKPGRNEEEVVRKGAHYRVRMPRVQLQMTKYKHGEAKMPDAKRAEARGVAHWFAQLREAGHRPGEMVVLMGAMTHAEVYAQALREEGFSCVVAGGSGFYGAPEVQLMGCLLRALANANDTEALFAVLSSEMLMLSADDFVQLATDVPAEDGKAGEAGRARGGDKSDGSERDAVPRRIVISRKLVKSLPEDASPRLRFAGAVLQRAWNDLGARRPSSVLRNVLEDSGWLTRLADQGADGQAQAANVLKVVRIVEGLEAEEGFDMARVARKFSQLESKKEKMGALVGNAADSVRLMTVHSSKGLEFPLVAIVDCYDVSESLERLELLTLHGKAYLSLMPLEHELKSPVGRDHTYLVRSGEEFEHLALDLGDLVETADSPSKYKAALVAHRKREALYEKRRLFYVAATRASEAMLIACTHSVTKKGGNMPPLLEDIEAALFGVEGYPDENVLVDYKGSEPLVYTCLHARAEKDAACEEGEGSEEGAVSPAVEPVPTMAYPVLAGRGPVRTRLRKDETFGLVSYSAIAKHDGAPAKASSEERAARAADADKATEFGSALHRLAQLEVLAGVEAARSSVERMAKAFGLADVERLRRAFERWLASDCYAESQAYEVREPEMPFCVSLADEVDLDGVGGGVGFDGPTEAGLGDFADAWFLEGEMDLFCSNGDREALVIDYKTGGFASETSEGLHDKHELQAKCYAYAVLMEGFEQVTLRFVRVEHAVEGDGAASFAALASGASDLASGAAAPAGLASDSEQLQVVSYRYSQEDVDELRAAIAERVRSSAKKSR